MKKAARAGRQFVIVRAVAAVPAGVNINSYFIENIDGAHAAGMRAGVYYSRALNEAQVARELETLFPLLEGRKFEYPIFCRYRG